MEEKMVNKSHKVVMTNRKNGSFTGIIDVISFDVAEILLETEMGMLHVKGKDLHVNRLNLDKGEVDIEGMIEGFSYSQIPTVAKSKEGGFLGKIFS
uniref:sporulation protein YabP n=1 Tax=Agathobacter sp. TaxID=2021311 RepID=UPI004056BBE9